MAVSEGSDFGGEDTVGGEHRTSQLKPYETLNEKGLCVCASFGIFFWPEDLGRGLHVRLFQEAKGKRVGPESVRGLGARCNKGIQHS